MTKHQQTRRQVIGVTLMAVTLCVAWSGAAVAAGTLTSPPVLANSSTRIVCSFLNLSAGSVLVTITVRNGNGVSQALDCSIGDDDAVTPGLVGPNKVERCTVVEPPSFNQNYWCQVTGNYTNALARGTLLIFDDSFYVNDGAFSSRPVMAVPLTP